MAKSKSLKKTKNQNDAVYLLKLVMYLILGSLWIKANHNNTLVLPVPVGLLIGLIFSMHDHFRIDRKIEYAVLLISTLIGFWIPFGIFVKF